MQPNEVENSRLQGALFNLLFQVHCNSDRKMQKYRRLRMIFLFYVCVI
jgi:hypothetical protein